MRRAVLVFLLLFAVVGTARADLLPQNLTPAELERQEAETEKVGEPFPGALVTPRSPQNAVDENNLTYRAACYVYLAERAAGSDAIRRYARRFIVHAPQPDSLPLARRVARLLLLLLGENRERLRYDHPADQTTLDVWLTPQPGQGLSPDVGGKQFKNQIYLYDLTAERAPLEWAREVAHEYGHYALPGVAGFTAPEEWANGVLGERLFLKWLRDDLRAGKLSPDDVPFVAGEQLDEYLQRRVIPLLRRAARDGLDERPLRRKDAAGMDYYTGIALYLDTVYGSRALLDAFTYTTPQPGKVLTLAPDFLRGALASLRSATELIITPPFAATESGSVSCMVYLPRGEFTVAFDPPARSWQFPPDTKGLYPQSANRLIVNTSAWRKLTVRLSASSEKPVRLTFQRRGVGVE